MSDEGCGADFAEMAKLAPEHAHLEQFVGKWRAEVKFWMGPGDPMVTTGTMVNELDLDGKFLKQTYTGDPSEGPFPAFEGRGFFGFNKQSGKYQGLWIDNAATMMHIDEGTVDAGGKRWEMIRVSENPGGNKGTNRTEVIIEDTDHHTMASYWTPEGGEESKHMEIKYERA